MSKIISAFLLSTAALLPLTSAAEGPLARFEGGIGVIPVSAGPAPNVVNGISPGGQPWVIARLSANIKSDGRISVEGRGLLLAGGNGIGTSGGQSVRALLFCGGVMFNSDLVPLAANGDFEIDGMLSAVPPSPCTTPVLLIVNPGPRWFAAGIPKL